MRAKNKQSILITENNAQIEIDFCDKILEIVAKKNHRKDDMEKDMMQIYQNCPQV